MGAKGVMTLEDYFAGYPAYKPSQDERARAADLMLRVNELLRRAAAGGVRVRINPTTLSRVSGTKNGGFRMPETTVGAATSRHKQCRAVDIYDPYRELAEWAYAHEADLVEIGLWCERPEWTPTWLHVQSEPPGSKQRWFVPSADAPLAPPLKAQQREKA